MIATSRDKTFAVLGERIAAINDVLNAASVLVWDSRTMPWATLSPPS